MADVKPLVRHSSGYPADLGSDTLVAEELKITTTRGIDAGLGRITRLAQPTTGEDAATKAYVDSVAAGLSVLQPARVASTANINLASPGGSIDGITLVVNDRVLVKDQTTKTQNGVYLFKGASVAMVRAADTLASGSMLMVNEGTKWADTQWVLTAPDAAIVIGTSNIVFTQFRTLADLTAGRAIDITGNTVSVKTGDGIKATGDIAVDRGNGLTASGTVAVLPKPSGGLAVDAAGVSAVAGAGISVGASIAVALKANSGLDTTGGLGLGAGNGLQTAGGTTSVKPDSGIQVGAAGVGVKADKGIAVGASGVGVKGDGTKGIEVDATAGVQVKLASGLDFDGSGNIRFSGKIIQSVASPLVVSGEAIPANSAVCMGAAGVLTAKSGTAGRGDVVGIIPGGPTTVGDNPFVYFAGIVPSFVSGLANGQVGFLGPTGALQATPPATGRIVRVGVQTAAGFVIAIADYGER